MPGALPGETGEITISRLIEKLNSLLEGEQAAAELVACGQRAIAPLRRFLMEGRPSSVYHPRRWAVEALAGLEAKEALLEYLRNERPIPDPVARLGEEAVQNAAAMALKEWPGEDVYKVLAEILHRQYLVGAIQTLGELGYKEAIPHIISALDDDVSRAAAENALRSFGKAAISELMLAALNPSPDREEESPTSLLRRSSAAQLLAEIGVSAEQWIDLRPLIDETAPAILIAVARMAWQVPRMADVEAVAARLVAAIGDADWYFRDEIADVLVEIYDAAWPAIEREIAKRINQPLEKRVLDTVLRTLLRVTRRIQEGQ